MRIHKGLIVLVVLLSLVGCSLPKFSLFPQAGPLQEVTLEGSGKEKILVISISGVISDKPKEKLLRSHPSMVQEVVTHLKRAEQDPQIKALLLKVNSPGGGVTASDILYHEIKAYKERTGVTMVVAMMNVAASGGYYISLPADWILAHPTTVTGSIGVIFARPGVSGFMEKFGFSMNISKSGVHKDMGSPFRPSNEADEAIFNDLTNQMAHRFLDLVTQHRSLKPEQQDQIATARIFLAPKAKELGLVDQVGYLTDAIAKAKALAELSDDASVVTFRRYESKEDNIYNPAMQAQGSEIGAMAPALGALVGASHTGFYYIWPAAFGGD